MNRQPFSAKAVIAAWAKPAQAPDATPTSDPRAGTSRAQPVPLGETAHAGPLELQVREVLIGDEAVAAILAASPHNDEPRDGTTYVAVNLTARNVGDAAIWLDNDDFALTGDSGLVHRFLGVKPPDPALSLSVAPGDAVAGWVSFGVPADEGSLLLLFDSVTLDGVWADRVLALQEGAAIADQPQRAAAKNAAGRTPDTALAIEEPAVTEQWSVTLLEVISGEPAFDLVDYRTGALGAEDAAGADGSIWVAMRFRVQNAQAGGAAATFPTTAFALVDDAGEPIPDIATLTPPWPDAAGDYYPAATREGWVMFDVPVDYGAGIVRFLPFAHSAPTLDPRYFRFA